MGVQPQNILPQKNNHAYIKYWHMDYLLSSNSSVNCLTNNEVEDRKRLGSKCLRLIVFCLAFSSSKSYCEEFTFFKLTDAEGSMRLGYTLNKTNIDQGEGSKSFEKRPALQQELSVSTRSYIFHPNLLEMELDAGLQFEQEELENNSETITANNDYFDFSGRWNFLKKKAYPISLYYTQRNPTQAVGFADSVTLKTQSYGMRLLLREPMISTPMSFRIDHIENKGDSSTTNINDTTDTFSADIRLNISDRGYGQLGFTTVSEESESGSLNLPLQVSTSDTDSLDWNSNVRLGDKQNITLSNYLFVTKSEQSNVPDRDLMNFYSYVNWDINESVDIFNTLNYSGSEYDNDITKTKSIVVGSTNKITDSWTVNASLEGTKENNTGFERGTKGFTAGLYYQEDINERWSSSLRYSALYRINNQTTDLLNIPVLDERQTLSGLTAVSLINQYVVPGSISVSNQNYTQTYIENIDYRITVIGSETRIERLTSGSISDGQTVSVDYAYEAGGSFDFNEFNQAMNVLYSLDKRYNFVIYYSTNKQILQDGIPVRDMESVKRYRLSADAQLPISKTMDYGWKLELEKRIDDLHPYSRAEMNLNYNSVLPFFGGIANLGTGYEYVDNELSDIDIKESYYSAIISLRPGWGSIASLELTHRNDKGGLVTKSTNNAALTYTWARGRLGFSLVGEYVDERQGDTLRDYLMLNASLTRYIR